MLTKSILTLAAASLAAVLAQTPVRAADSSINARDHRATVERKIRDHRAPAPVQTRDHRLTKQDTTRDHRNGRKNEVVKVSRKDCRSGAENLRRSGYRQIKMLDCRGSEYSYLAKKHHALFGAKMNAYSGKMKVSFLGNARSH
ncbi:hypothetical protein [Hoeflea ulvae]|uniref:Uncharacterized protein n=1 Tax=Hoeflea ulvae TaxID=2983764 RepID=A0ABT3Y9Z5_9HYPH|nr:hypothetical protein [Hoeflea ulvae]MCY0092701.1 hypothetical protein [Hoeflea ulvae]